jgi:anti-anti-sigma factor
MEITSSTVDGCKVVRLSGNLDTNTSPQAQAFFEDLVEAESTCVVADFSAVDYISSAGLRVLLVAAKKLRRVGGELRICSLNEMATEVFEISGFATLFKIFPDADSAVTG